MRIDRMLAIVVLLLNRRRITARELADRFEISLRTVYRDIESINEAGVPVVSNQGNGGGYSIMDNYRLNHQFLSLDNIRAILTALKGVNSTLQDRDLDLIMEKIHSMVPPDQITKLDNQLDQFVVDYLPWGYNERMQEQIRSINRSIAEKRMLTIRYQNLKGEETERNVEPMTLLFKGYNWYLFGYCLQKQDGRIFRLSRIRSIQFLNSTFTRRDIQFKDFTKNEDASDRQRIELVLKFENVARPRVEDSFHPEQITRQEDGSLIVRVFFPEDRWVYSMILSYGEYVEVLQPQHMRQIICDISKKIQSRYQT